MLKKSKKNVKYTKTLNYQPHILKVPIITSKEIRQMWGMWGQKLKIYLINPY